MDSTPYQKLLTKKHHAIGVALTVLFYAVMSVLLVPYTFSTDPLIAQGQAALTAFPIAAVFWFAYNMFMLVLTDQLKRRRAAQTAE